MSAQDMAPSDISALRRADLATAIAQTRHVYEGDKGAEGALDYLEAVLEAGLLDGQNTPQSRMDAQSDPATSGTQVLAHACTTTSAAPTQDLAAQLADQREKTDTAVRSGRGADIPACACTAAGAAPTCIAQALAQVEQLKLVTEGAVAVLAVIGGAMESAAADDTLQLVLEELRGLRAELAAGRRAGAEVLA